MKKLFRILLWLPLAYIGLVLCSLPLGYLWEFSLPYRLFRNVDIDTYDFSWGGPLQESNWELVGKLKGKLPEEWMLTSFYEVDCADHYLERFLDMHPNFNTWDIELYKEDTSSMAWSYALHHRPSGTIFITMGER